MKARCVINYRELDSLREKRKAGLSMKSQVSAWVVRAMFIALLPLFVALLILPWPKGPRSFVKTLLFVTQVLPLPAKPLQWLTRSPLREELTYPVSQGAGSGDLYRPANSRKRAGVLVFLGIIPVPQDDPRVVNLGTALARLGFIALFPWSRAMMDKRITPEEPGNMVEAFNRLADMEGVDADRLGMVGFCVGGSVLALAASDPRINDRVGFLSAFGAYYDIGDVMAQIASHTSAFHDDQDPWEANHLSKEVMATQAVEALEQEHDRQALTKAFLEGEAFSTEAPEGLSADADIVFRLLRSMAETEVDHRLSIGDAQGAGVPALPILSGPPGQHFSHLRHRQPEGPGADSPRPGGRSSACGGVQATWRKPLRPGAT